MDTSISVSKEDIREIFEVVESYIKNMPDVYKSEKSKENNGIKIVLSMTIKQLHKLRSILVVSESNMDDVEELYNIRVKGAEIGTRRIQ